MGLYYIGAGTLRDKFIEYPNVNMSAGVSAGWAANADNRPPYWDPRSEPPMSDYDATNAADTSLIDFENEIYGTGPEAPAPTIASLTPNSAPYGGANVLMIVTGSGFRPSSVILWDGKDEPTEVVSETQCSTWVVPSIHGAAQPFNVEVRNGEAKSNTLVFNITAPGRGADEPEAR